MFNKRFSYDRVETEVRSLDCLGPKTANYGLMLVPVLMEKIPSQLKLMISRECSSEELWNINLAVVNITLTQKKKNRIKSLLQNIFSR